jgi:hypothetical protein
MMRLVIGLNHPHLAEEEAFLQELGTKGSPNFQKFLTADEWNKRFGPSVADEQAVVDWANSQGLTVSHRFGNRLLVDIEAPVENVEKALGVGINNYQVGSRAAFSNDRNPVIPSAMAGIIHSIGGLNSIQVYHPKSKLPEPNFENYVAGPVKAAAASGAHDAAAGSRKPASLTGPTPNITGGAYDPTDIFSSQAYDVQALYNQGHCCNPLHASGVTPPESSIAIATAGTQSGSDFSGFHNAYPYLADHWQQFYIDGTPSCCDGEGTLDFDWSTAWSNSFGSYVDTAMIYMYDGVNPQFSTFTDVYNHILSDQHAKVFSTSWGCEELACTPASVMDTDHGIFNAMVGQGMTLVAATGDQGATAGCGNAIAVQHPASDPNIVGAGGTTLRLYSNGNFYSETGWEGGPYGCSSNDGGSTGGLSAHYATPSYQSSLGVSSRALPDIALNGDWYNTPQNYFFNGSLSGNGGTSIVAPSVAGFFAQANSYMDFVATQNGGCYGGTTCAPIGNGNWYLYWFGENPSYAPHYPFYDVTSGCNDNDVTAYYGLGYWCAGTGYDEVTGWGSFNALQLAWAINTYRAGDWGNPYSSFSGPATSHWFNTDQLLSWTVTDTGGGYPATGIAGFSRAWDVAPSNSTREPHGGSGDSFYSGPQFVNATSGSLYLSSAGQGCHTANVRSWDNSGFSANNTYGPVCYDTVAPVSSATFSGTLSGGVYTTSVTVTESATDASSGVATKFYSLDGGANVTYSSPFTVSTTGAHTVKIYSRDNAGNSETAHSYAFTIKSPTATILASSLNPAAYGQPVTFTATVKATFGAVATGSVTFKDGATVLGTATLSSGKAVFATSKLHGATHSITAAYAGSGTDVASTSAALSQKVNKTTSTTTLASSVHPSKYGAAVTFTATIISHYGGTVTGTVTFKNNGSSIGSVSVVSGSTNKATLTYSGLLTGSHSITAVYNGSADDSASSSSAFTQVVQQASTTTALVASPNPSTHGTKVTFTATITSSPASAATGTVTFKSSGTTIGTATVSGNKATFSYSTFTVGNHYITATYGGDANHVTSVSPQVTVVAN